MARRRKKKLPEQLFEAEIESLSHDGRGIARIEGKTTFLDNALPGERVRFQYTNMRRKFDEGRACDIVQPSPDRVTPPCAHALICGGCSLQHLDTDKQVARKQQVLEEQFAHFGGLQPAAWREPLRGPVTGYRGKARMGAKYVEGKGTALVGFREKRNSFLADIQQCEVLIEAVGHHLADFRSLISALQLRDRIPQIEVAAGEDAVALVFRHMDPLPDTDQQALLGFCQQHGFHCYLQPAGPESVHRIWPAVAPGEAPRLHYRHPAFDVELAFHPMDFTQVNRDINQHMVEQAIDLLDVAPSHRVLDLFCGLGNFTIPLATRAAQVVGVEVSDEMVQRGAENARRNHLENVQFYRADLSQPLPQAGWATAHYDRVLLDPARTGALEICQQIQRFNPKKLVYVSCNPATLARDAGELLKQGYHLVQAGVMDMFPHTTHVESIAVFEQK